MNEVRILIIHDQYSVVGGAETQNLRIIGGLSRDPSFEVASVSFDNKERIRERALDDLKLGLHGSVEDDSSVQGRVCMQRGSRVEKGALVRGPATMGENSFIGSGAYIGPYTSVGSNCDVRSGEIENSIVMGNCVMDVSDRIADSLIGPNSRIVSNRDNAPRGRRFIVGESSTVML